VNKVVGGFTQFFVDPITGQVVGVHGHPKIMPEFYDNPQIFNPSLEMHANIKRLVQEDAGKGADQLQEKIQQLYQMYGDHSGMFGNSGGFDIRLTDSTVQVDGVLPGDWSDGTSPTVDVLGGTLVIQGKSDFHRVFNLPANVEKNAQVKFATKTGKLQVILPRRGDNKAIDGSDDFADDDFVDPRVRAMHESLDDFSKDIRDILKSGSQASKNKLAAKLRSKKKAMQGELDIASELIQKLDGYHGPNGNYALPHPIPHKETVSQNEVELVGCFKYTQLPDDKKLGPNTLQAGSFNLVYDHMAEATYMPKKPDFFAIARHGAPINSGDVYSFNAMPSGSSISTDRCGTPCHDDSTRFCGCMDKQDREKGSVFVNNDCRGETKFAVYKIKSRNVPPAVESQKDLADQEGTNWRLQRDEINGTTSLEMIVPAAAMSYSIEGRLMVIYGPKKKNGEEDPISKLHIPFEVDSSKCSFLTVHGDTHHVIRCPIPAGQLTKQTVVARDEF
jgi:HSP20 family molecular chaperone IbpA